MDTHLFKDIAPARSLPEDGPMNRRRIMVYAQSLWFNTDHEDFYLCRFEDYLACRGWDRELIMNGKWREAHPDNANKSDEDCIVNTIAVLQGWLTLGFLEDLFQNRQWTQRYLRPLSVLASAIMPQIPIVSTIWPKVRRNDAGEALILNTKHLISNLVALLLQRHPDPEHLARLPTIIGHYGRAIDDLGNINVYDSGMNVTRNPIDPDLESGALIRLFKPVPMLMFEAVIFTSQQYTPDFNVNSHEWHGHLVKELCMENHWCPYTIEKLFHTTDLSVVHWLWASNLNSLDTRDHSRCSKIKCYALHASSEGEYPEKHATGCNQHCPRYLPNTSQVSQALSRDQIPLIVAKPCTSNPSDHMFSIDTINPENGVENTSFVAFSHVWADGLGSTTEQGLPSCQVNYLARICRAEAKRLDGSSTFWIDSLCIPQDRGLRRKAIQMMASVYRSAKTVLVLDDTLRQVALYVDGERLSSPELLLLRVYTSPWNSRVWTYQEASLAQKLVFILANDESLTLDFPVSLDGGPHVSPVSVARPLDSMRHVYRKLRAEVQALTGQLNNINIGTVALQLRWRDTLHRDPRGRNDEILAVGTVLRLNMRVLLDEPAGPRRMALFYKLVKRVYSNIVFTDVPRLQIDGFRWAPETLLVKDERRPQINLEEHGAECTEHGLLGSYVTISVESGTVPYTGSHRVTLSDGQRSFDVFAAGRDGHASPFLFSHIIIYPSELPSSTRVPIFVAAALLEDKHFTIKEQNGFRPNLTATFQEVVHLLWLRNWGPLVDRTSFPDGEFHATFTVARKKVLIR